jgi:protoporphyrinogen oxidase
MKIALIGGGLMGLALARHLARAGHAVAVFEREEQLGGLATYHDYGPFHWDRFYHVILPSDTHLIGFLRDIGLGDQLHWTKTRTGFYVDETFYSMSSSLEFLLFPALPLWSKARLAATILYCARIDDWQRLERVTVEDWLRKTCGGRTFEKIWRPLLLAKLGEHYQRVSAVFIWSYIKRLYSARDSSAQKETLGYVSGGYKTVFDRLQQLIGSAGGRILTDVGVQAITAHPEGGLSVDYQGQSERFDKAVYTAPVGVLERTVSEDLFQVERRDRGVEYLGVICMVLVTRKPLVPYYVVNIADDRIPFTGIIGMSNLVAVDETRGLHITYLPKYVHSEDPMLRASDDELRNQFLDGLRIMLPEFREDDVLSVHINRAVKVQPLQVLEYSALVPKVVTRHPDLFVLNTSQFVNCTLNNNEVIRAVDEFVSTTGAALAAS